MTIPEIIGGVIVLIASVLIIIFTVSQRTKGQGLSGVLTGSNPMAGSRVRQEDVMLGKLTKITAIVLFVVTILACALSARLG